MPNVIFNGDNKTITLVSGSTSIDAQVDIYSDWKEWALLNPSYPQALRSAGGDPLPGGKATGRYYFLLNNWKLVPSNATTYDVEVQGNIFTEDGSNLFVTSSGVQLIRQVVSQLSDITFVSSSGGGGLTPIQESTLNNINVVVTNNSSSLNELQLISNQQTSSLNTIITSQSIQDDKLNTILSTGGSLTPSQSIMLLEMYDLLGLDPTKPLIVSTTSRIAGAVTQSISQMGSVVTVTRL